jgi:hypothetical protein
MSICRFANDLKRCMPPASGRASDFFHSFLNNLSDTHITDDHVKTDRPLSYCGSGSPACQVQGVTQHPRVHRLSNNLKACCASDVPSFFLVRYLLFPCSFFYLFPYSLVLLFSVPLFLSPCSLVPLFSLFLCSLVPLFHCSLVLLFPCPLVPGSSVGTTRTKIDQSHSISINSFKRAITTAQ